VLVTQAARTLAEGGERLPATGPSFRDATRVAGAPSRIWTDIYLSNRDALVTRIDDTIARLHTVREALAAGDAEKITGWNDDAADDRRRLLEAQLAGGPLFELRASVPNRPGVVAQLALELGRAGVNITDMALYPAPDMSEGVVALWIAGEDQARRTEELVGHLGFPVARA
jgi:prephenate dehydrogenase